MKNLSKVGLLLLMLLLVAGAFILPKFVQRAAPPTPKEDLAAALAAVDVPDHASDEGITVETGLRANPEYQEFFEFLNQSDFEAARESLLSLSQTTDEKTVEALTNEMEKSVNALATVETTLFEEVEPTETGIKVADLTPESATVPAYDSGKTIEILTLIQMNEFDKVEKQMELIKEAAPADTTDLLENSLAEARKKQEELEASRLALKRSKEEVSTLQKEGVAQIKESVAELKKATLSANLAVKEVNALRAKLENPGPKITDRGNAEQAEPVKKKTESPPKVPSPTGITFGFDSTQLNEASKKKLAEAAEQLKAEPRLTLQLRGYADPSGSSEYNAILAKARSEAAKDFLIEKQIGASRVSVISFGETRSEKTAGPETLRRVDLIFRVSSVASR